MVTAAPRTAQAWDRDTTLARQLPSALLTAPVASAASFLPLAAQGPPHL